MPIKLAEILECLEIIWLHELSTIWKNFLLLQIKVNELNVENSKT